jgi:hypothetical protein
MAISQTLARSRELFDEFQWYMRAMSAELEKGAPY